MLCTKTRKILPKALFFLLTLFFFSCSKKAVSTTTSSSRLTEKAKAKVSSSSSKADKVIAEAKSYYGTKYKYGGSTSSGIDCSGLMCKSFSAVGITLPRVSRDQSNVGKRVYIGELKKGDLIFFAATKGSQKIIHVGLISYVTKSTIKFLHSSSSKGVIESELSTYWRDRYVKATRPL